MKRIFLILLLLISFAKISDARMSVGMAAGSAGSVAAAPGASCSTTVCAVDATCTSGHCSGVAATCMANDETCTEYTRITTDGGSVGSIATLDSWYTAVKSTSGGLASVAFSHDANFGNKVSTTTLTKSYDPSSNNNDVTSPQNTTVTASCINSLKCWSYTGTTAMTLSAVPSLSSAGSLLAVVAGHSGISASQQILYYGLSATPYQPYIIIGTDSSKNYNFVNVGASAGNSSSTSSTSSDSTTFYTIEDTWNTSWIEANAKINGGTSITVVNGGTMGTITGQQVAVIGNQWNGSQLAHITAFTSQLSSGDMTIMRNWLKNTYGHY